MTPAAITDGNGIWRMTVPVPRWRRGETTLWIYEWTFVTAEVEGYLAAHRSLTITGETPTWIAPPFALAPVVATVSGRVVDPEGRAILGARVRIGRMAPFERHGRTLWSAPATNTDDRGRFGPVSVPPGHLRVRAWAYGWRALARWVHVRRRNPPDTPCVELVLAALPRVTGSVVDETGQPIPGVRFRYPYRGEIVEVTDGQGPFTWPMEESLDSVKVRPEKEGYIDLARLSVDVSPAGGELVLRLPPLHTMTVTVLDARTGRPLEGATVVGPNAQDLALTDALGIASLVHGDPNWLWHVLTVRHPGYATGELPLLRDVAGTARTLALTPLVPIEVTVRTADGEPVPGAVITWRGEWPHRDRMETTSGDGMAAFALPADASPTLEVDHPRLGTGVVSIRPSGIRRRVGVILEPREESPVPEDSEDEKTGEISGKVVDADGHPVPVATSTFGRLDTIGRRSVQTDGLGRFRIGGMPPGWADLLRLGISRDLEAVRLVWAAAGDTDLRIVAPGLATVRVVAGDGPPARMPQDGTAWLLDQRDPVTGSRVNVDVSWRRVAGAVKAVLPAGTVLIQVAGREGIAVVRRTLVSGEESVLRLRPRPEFPLRGVVIGSDGAGAAGAVLTDATTGQMIGETGEQGTILPTAGILPVPGPLRVSLEGSAPLFTEPVDLERGANLIVHMTLGGTVNVVVRGAGKHLGSRLVRLRRDLGRHGPWRRCGTSGACAFAHVPAGLRRFEVWVPGHRPVIREVYVTEGGTADLEITVPVR